MKYKENNKSRTSENGFSPTIIHFYNGVTLGCLPPRGCTNVFSLFNHLSLSRPNTFISVDRLIGTAKEDKEEEKKEKEDGKWEEEEEEEKKGEQEEEEKADK